MTSDAASAPPEPHRRGRRALPRPAPHRHHQHRRQRHQRRASGWPPSTSRRSSPRSAWSRDPRERAGPGQRGRPVSRAPTRRPRARCWCTATSTWCRPTPTSGRCTRSPARSRDGYLWGRGAIDMKDFDAMVLAVGAADARARAGVARRATSCWRSSPTRRPAATTARTSWSSTTRTCSRAAPRRSARSAASPYTVGDDLRLYLIETAEKGLDWLRLHAKGRPGHGSMIHDDNAVTALAEAVARVGRHRFPVVVTPTVRAFLERGLRRARHRAGPGRPGDRRSPSSARSPTIIGATIRNTANPTRLAAGYKDNVIPGRATATIDCRTPARPARELPGAAARGGRPGHRDRVHPASAAAGDHLRRRRWSRRWRPRCGPRTRARGRCRTCSPAAPTPRRSRSSASAASASPRCGCRADLNFAALFHGIDERVPVEGLQFGVRVLDRLPAHLLTQHRYRHRMEGTAS